MAKLNRCSIVCSLHWSAAREQSHGYHIPLTKGKHGLEMSGIKTQASTGHLPQNHLSFPASFTFVPVCQVLDVFKD